MSTDRPVIFEVQMLNAIGKPGRYRVLRNHPGRFIFESFGRVVTLPEVSAASGEQWVELHSRRTLATLICLGGQAGPLGIDDLEALEGKDYGPPDMGRLASAVFISPVLVPCGFCGDWNPIEAAVCADCSKDPRRIVEPCVECGGSGESHPYTTRDPVTCPLCDGSKVVETPIGKARFRYLRRCVDAKILTEEEAGAAFIEE